jgi:hypothetical protein
MVTRNAMWSGPRNISTAMMRSFGARSDAVLMQLCAALGVAFDPSMLRWPAGRRDSDGVWAPAWYDAVERSTGFAAPGAGAKPAPVLTDELRALAERAQPYYETLARYRIRG